MKSKTMKTGVLTTLGLFGALALASAQIAPVAVTLPADAITTNSARLNGQVNPQGAPTSAWFQYGLTTNYGGLSTPQAVGSGFSFSNLNTVVHGLTLHVFHYR